MAILFLPGVIIHEFAHFFFALFMLAPVGTIEFMPKMMGDQVKLGSVAIGKTDPIRRALIGIAPVIVGIGVLVAFISFLFSTGFVESGSAWWEYVVASYFVFVIGNTMFSSQKDMEGTIEVVLVFVVLYLLLFFLHVPVVAWINTFFSLPVIVSFLFLSVKLLFIPIGIDGVVYLLLSLGLRGR